MLKMNIFFLLLSSSSALGGFILNNQELRFNQEGTMMTTTPRQKKDQEQTPGHNKDQEQEQEQENNRKKRSTEELELAALKEEYSRLDWNKDGNVNVTEWRHRYTGTDENLQLPRHPKSRRFMARVVWKEFFVYKNFKEFEEDMRGGFEQTDTNKNGYIDVCEYRPVVLEELRPFAYEPFNERDVLEIMFEADVDKDGQISFLESVLIL